MARPPKYGVAPDGRPRDPWHDETDAQALGHESTTKFREWFGRQKGRSRGESLGKPERGGQLVSQQQQEWPEVYTTEGVRDVIATGPRQWSTLGRYERDVRAVVNGELAGATFRRRWRGRRVGGFELESDPDRVKELRRREGPGPTQRYRRVQFAGAAA